MEDFVNSSWWEKRHKCKKPLPGIKSGLYSGNDAWNMLISNADYDCKACGSFFCLDCVADLKKKEKPCPICKGALGW